MLRSFIILSVVLISFSVSVNAQKRALSHEDVAGWNKLYDNEISADGKWASYLYGPDEGDRTVVVHRLSGGSDYLIPRGLGAQFTFDSQYLVCLIKPQLDSVRVLKRLKKKKEELPGDSLAIYKLQAGSIQKFPHVISYKLPKKDGTWIAWQSEDKNGSKDSTAKNGKLQSGENGYTLQVYRFGEESPQSYPYVKDYTFSEDGTRLTFHSTGDEQGFAAGIYTIAKKDLQLKPVFRKKGTYNDLQVSKDGNRLAFLFDSDTIKKPFQSYGLFHWTPKVDSASIIAGRGTSFPQQNWQLARTLLQFSDDNKRLFFAVQPVPVLGDTTLLDEEKPKLDIWNYKEGFLQTQQKVNASLDRNKGYLAVYHFDSGTPIQLSDQSLQKVDIAKEGTSRYAIGIFESPEYLLSVQWEGSPGYKDIYVVDINTGKHQLVKEKVRANPLLSPQGQFGYWYDVQDTSWYALEMGTGRVTRLTDNSTVSFSDETNDSPNYPSAYGIAGWMENDAQLLVYDRFDIWKVDPRNPASRVRITKNGRESAVVYRYIKTDPEELNIPLSAGLLLKGFNEKTKQHGFFSLQARGSEAPRQLIMADAQLEFLKKARQAGACLVTRETFNQFADLQYTTLKFDDLRSISNINPQQDEFLWGTEELVSWVSLDGLPLQGLLFKPENFDPAKKYPLMVNFYERNSDRFHHHWTPEFNRSSINYSFYTSRGYVVFVPDIVYKIGYPGESALNCVMPGVTALIEKGYIDKDRVGVQGHSWGGYQIAYMVTRTQLFKAAEAGAPVPNMTSAYGGIRWETGLSRMFQYEHTQSRIGGSLWEYPLRFLENSPIFWLDKVGTPLLLMHNDADGHVPWYQGIELFVALRRLGKPSWMITYNEQPHWPLLYPNRKDWAMRMQQFFDYYLKDAPMPLWMDKGVPATEKGIHYGLEFTGEEH